MLDHGTALAVDVMSSFEYNIQHIDNSINIPINKLLQQKDKLPKDKSFPIIFYCMGKR
jgi:rhodanese-related sulfurtransferase